MCRRMSCTEIPKDSSLFTLFQSALPFVSSVFSLIIVLICKGVAAKCCVRWRRLLSGVSGEKSIALLDLGAPINFGDMQAIISSSSEAAGLGPLLPAEEEIDGELE